MNEHNEHLLEALEHLLMMKNECSCSIFSECGLSDMTVRQIAYLKAIDGQGDVTFSRLAEITNNSKPTITEMVNRFVRMDCVYREPCRDDGRILYIRLTDKGKTVACAEEEALRRLVGRMVDSLDEQELELLIRLLSKVR
jgi:DNA-binding MarR family transcriptional regulator